MVPGKWYDRHDKSIFDLNYFFYLKTCCIDVGDGCWRRNVSVTVSVVFVINILYLFTLMWGRHRQSFSKTIDNPSE